MMPLTVESCPCCRSTSLKECCQPYLQGAKVPTPEVLMRSRYTAFVLNQTGYLLDTWHTTTRPAQLPPDLDTQWASLVIVAAPPPSGTTGSVHFRAFFRDSVGWHVLEEVSRFCFEEGRWWYLDGEPRVERLKPRRNERCLCGSGRKLKVCCGE